MSIRRPLDRRVGMRVMLLGILNQHVEAKPPTKEAILAMHQFNEELEKAGVLLDLGGLKPGVRVHYSGGKRTVTDGPFAETKELIVGYTLLDVKDLAEAVEWAKRSPCCGEEVVVEIRPLFDPSDFDPGKGV
jgi:hypothetical protein